MWLDRTPHVWVLGHELHRPVSHLGQQSFSVALTS